MDELFLQIMSANELAQKQIEIAQSATNTSAKDLKEFKQTLDASLLETFNEQARSLNEKTQALVASYEAQSRRKFEQSKSLLEKDFKEISENFHQKILKEVTTFHGK